MVRDVDARLDRDLQPALNRRQPFRVGSQRLSPGGRALLEVLERLAQGEEPPGDRVTVDQ
jgi:hypothetical protein